MNGIYIDATVGTGGHSLYILRNTNAKIMCFDADPESLQIAKERLKDFKKRVRFYNENFIHIFELIDEKVDGVLFDLGLSSRLVGNPERGFSYRLDGPLDMRYSKEGITAYESIKSLGINDLRKILSDYGGVKYSKRIAYAIKKVLPTTTLELAQTIRKSVGKYEKKAVMKVFQSLRIYVNNEFEVLKQALTQTLNILKKGGRLIIISYHSGEDKIVMKFFRTHTKRLKLLTKKVIKPTKDEIEKNKRARSAKLRAFEVI